MKKRLLVIIPLVGSICIIVGSWLPWISFLGGLQTFAGVSGLNGKILFVSGILSLVLSSIFLFTKTSLVQWSIRVLGFLQFAFCSYLLVNLLKTFHQLGADPMNSMMIGGIGPGLFVATFGALLLFTTFFFNK